MEIHRANEVDIADVTDFVNRIFSGYADLKQSIFASMNSTMNEGIYCLVNDSDLVVVATIHSSSIHPFCKYVRVAYDITKEESMEIQSVVEFLKEECIEPLFFLLDNRFVNLANLLLNEEFRFIRKTEIIRFQPQLNEVGVIQKEVKSVSEIIDQPVLLSSLIELCKCIYIQTHLDNPVVEMSLARWEKLILSDLVQETSYVVLDENKVIAFSLMHVGEEDCWELGWIGVAAYDEIDLLDHLLKIQIRDAAEQGILKIEKEVDSTCPYSLHVSKSLAYEVSDTLYAYIEEVY